MDETTKQQNSDQGSESNPPSASQAANQAKMVNPSEDLIYNQGTVENPEEVLANPAVAPQMLDDRRDLRPDRTRNLEVEDEDQKSH